MQVWLSIIAFLSVIVGGDIRASESAESVAEQLAKAKLSESTSASSASTPSDSTLQTSIPFKDRPYERFVSLGDRCHTNYSINHHIAYITGHPLTDDALKLKDDLPRRKPYHWGGMPFDWTRIENYAALAAFIERDFTEFFEKDQQTGYWDYGTRTPTWDIQDQALYDKRNCITRRKFLEQKVIKEGTEEFIQPSWDQEYARGREKISYLLDKFRGLKKHKTLYVIYALVSDNDLIALEKALTKNRGNDNFTIFMGHHETQDRTIGERIIIRRTYWLNWEGQWYWPASTLAEFKLDPKILEGLRESYKSGKTQ